ncbi:MinD/ParA family protein [Magnetococcus sp. PR-3]|uniref:MinD/ParA family protein n=1 Tax=Magnetococcus sp. PR-3 TaxID=3120355 RepID=UPI002FCE040D
MIDDMDNQAARLRELTEQAQKQRDAESRGDAPRPSQPLTPTGDRARRKVPYTLAVTSGKGGVGKTLVSVNLAVQFAQRGLKVLIIDADLGLANIDVVLGVTPKYNMADVLSGHKTLDDVVVEGPAGVFILPAASGVAELSDLTEEQRASLLDHLDNWNADIDVVIVDTGAGISPNVRYFILSVEKIVVVATPDPASITDAYALMKVMYKNHRLNNFELVVNQVSGAKEAKQVYKAISDVSSRFLNIGLQFAGFIPKDDLLQRAVREQQLVSLAYPEAEASVAFNRLSQWMVDAWQRQERDNEGRATFFWGRLLDEEDSPSTSEPESS